jgi:chromate transporter
MAVDTVPAQQIRPRASLLDIAIVFGRISATAFGGAALVMMRREMIRDRGWFTEREFLEIYALAQVCPGGLPVSIACLCGKRLAGIPGFVVALLAETIPGFFVLMALALLSLDPHMTLLRAALKGAAAAALGSLFANAIQMNWPYRRKVFDLGLIALVAVSVAAYHFSLWIVFAVFLPISIAIVQLRKEV